MNLGLIGRKRRVDGKKKIQAGKVGGARMAGMSIETTGGATRSGCGVTRRKTSVY